MGVQSLAGIRKAISNINPEHVRQLSDHQLRVAICAADDASYANIRDYLLEGLSPERRRASAAFLQPGYATGSAGSSYDLVIADAYVAAPRGAVVFHRERLAEFPLRVLKASPDFGVALARAFPPLRRPFIHSVIKKTANENTLFSLATALPDVIPSFIELPWALAEFASDTAFLTANQLRMAFLIAAASDRAVGYREQKSEIATVIAGAFGWRAIARQLVGKIPFGGGLLAKSAVAYAGTRVVGLSLERLYSYGYAYSREQRDVMYSDALDQGKKVAGRLLSLLKPRMAQGKLFPARRP